MKNYIQPGNNITVAAPAAVTSGAGVILGDLFGVANGDAESGADVVLSTVGVFELPKTTADDIAAGDTVYWDDSESEVTLTSTDNTKVGVAIAAAGAGTTTAKVRLNGSF
jgi:predicted RecA/RadA family phage recombinase